MVHRVRLCVEEWLREPAASGALQRRFGLNSTIRPIPRTRKRSLDRFSALAVVPRDVVNALGWGEACDAGVGSVVIVGMQPGLVGRGAGGF